MGSQNTLPLDADQHQQQQHAHQYMQHHQQRQQHQYSAQQENPQGQMPTTGMQQQQITTTHPNYFDFSDRGSVPTNSTNNSSVGFPQQNMQSQMLPNQAELMAAASKGVNQVHSEVFSGQQNPNQHAQYMDQMAKEKWLREQSSLTYSQEDTSNDGTFLKLSQDSRPQSFIPAFTQQQAEFLGHGPPVHPGNYAQPGFPQAAQPQPQYANNAAAMQQQLFHPQQVQGCQDQVPLVPQVPIQPPQHVFTWRHGGNEVLIIGSFNNWQTRTPMNRVNDHEFQLAIDLQPGQYEYKYIVDGHWHCADDQEKVRDQHGNLNNKVTIEKQPEQLAQTPQFGGYPPQQATTQSQFQGQQQQQYIQQQAVAQSQHPQQQQVHHQQMHQQPYAQQQQVLVAQPNNPGAHPQNTNNTPHQVGQQPQPQGSQQQHQQSQRGNRHQAQSNGAEAGESPSQYGQDMPDKFETMFEPALIPVHLQYNIFARDDLPLKSPNPDERLQAVSEDTLAPEILTKGIFGKVLPAPSHVILNHANCWSETNPTLEPNNHVRSVEHRVADLDDGRNSTQEKESVDKGMTSVSLTLRLNVNKFTTLTYYKPRIQPSGNSAASQGIPTQKTFIEDFSKGTATTGDHHPQLMQQQ